MNVFLMTDLEGISKITDISFMNMKSLKYRKACKFLQSEINLAVDTCFKCGADKVYYLDGHAGGGNVCPKKIDSRAVKCSVAEWQELLKKGEIDCLIELGAHARAGTMLGFLDHTMNSKKWFKHTINGKEMCESSLHAIICGKYSVPVVALTGDETVCEQIKEYIPNISVGAVKKALCRNKAEKYDNAEEIIVETIKKGLENYKSVSIFKVDEPAEITLTYYRTDMCEEALENCGAEVKRLDARTLTKTVEKITKYEDLKF